MDKFEFAGRTALVTGASSGIGQAFAQELARRGAHLVVTARSAAPLDMLADTLRREHGVNVVCFPADLTEPGAPSALYERIRAAGLNVDVLINNAGFGRWARFHCEDAQSYRDMLALNINAVVELTHCFVGDMHARGRGGVINVASAAAFQPVSYLAVYAATKSFVLSFTEALDGEYRRHGVRCLALCPGATATNFARVAKARVADRRPDLPEDVARAGLDALRDGRGTLVTGVGNYLLSLLPRFLPRPLAITIVARMFEKQAAPSSS